MKFFNNLKIGSKLNIGFGFLVVLTLVVIGFSYLGSLRTTTYINRTSDLSAPTALASARAQANLLRMLADVRGYLALGDESYRKGYSEARRAFEANLVTLETLAQRGNPTSLISTTPENYIRRLEKLRAYFVEWSRFPMHLFALHDDQLEREPGLQMLIEKGTRPIALIVVSIKKIIGTQRRREPTVENMALLGDIASFQASFFAMVSGLRGYVTTARQNFKFELQQIRQSTIGPCSAFLPRRRNSAAPSKNS